MRKNRTEKELEKLYYAAGQVINTWYQYTASTRPTIRDVVNVDEAVRALRELVYARETREEKE